MVESVWYLISPLSKPLKTILETAQESLDVFNRVARNGNVDIKQFDNNKKFP